MISVMEIKKCIVPVLKQRGVTRAGIFGSVARGEATADSDVDVLIEFEKGKSFFDLVRLERELRVVLEKKVDLLTYGSVNHLLKKKILEEEVRIL